MERRVRNPGFKVSKWQGFKVAAAVCSSVKDVGWERWLEEF
jgi:hypothetical protein